jgi:N-acetylglucosaminyldiphosphoundecaprenol N-acetyl-beta-D-mannosaminyltransferase
MVNIPPTFDVIGQSVHALTPSTALRVMEQAVDAGRSAFVCFANVHGVMLARRDAELRRAYAEALLVAPDGMPLVWVGRRAGVAVERVYGPDMALEVAGLAARRAWPVYFFGGGTGVAREFADRARALHPGLTIAGAETPPFEPLDALRVAQEAAAIARSGARVVLVGLGCPKQEIWMRLAMPHAPAVLMLGVGAAFDFHSGRVPQAPPWMRRAGFEWAFRLSREPRRLWYRYVVYNLLFVFHITAQMVGVRRYPPDAPS